VVGSQFHDYRQIFESRYEELNEIVDEVAERIRALGRQSIGTLAKFIRFTRLGEHPGEYPRAPGMIANLFSDYEKIIRQLRSDLDLCRNEYHHIGASDLLTGLMEQHEKTAWMLRAMLESKIEGSIRLF